MIDCPTSSSFSSRVRRDLTFISTTIWQTSMANAKNKNLKWRFIFDKIWVFKGTFLYRKTSSVDQNYNMKYLFQFWIFRVMNDWNSRIFSVYFIVHSKNTWDGIFCKTKPRYLKSIYYIQKIDFKLHYWCSV